MNYEVSHVYLDGNIGEKQRKGIDIYKKVSLPEDTASLMIDDYSLKHGDKNLISVEDIISFYNKHMSLSDIKYESEFVNIAHLFEDVFETKKETFRKESKIVTFMVIEGRKIKLKDEFIGGAVKYSCPALSASFHLFRAGMIEGKKIVKQKREICSILPEEYFHIEKQVGIILNQLDCVNSYIYY